MRKTAWRALRSSVAAKKAGSAAGNTAAEVSVLCAMMASDPNRLRERAQRVLAENQSEVQRIVEDVIGVLDETDRQLEADRSHIEQSQRILDEGKAPR
jgi:hypothetical protein